jgi:Nif-specific regulatory protein
LFLDEVSDLSPAAQAKLLRAIQDLSVERVGGCGARRVDTRIIVASNRSLGELVERGRFRLDLF